MSRKTSRCYQAVFKYIEKNVIKLEPGEFLTDFETGLRHAIRKLFPKALLRGCWYHYCAALRKKLLKCGLGRLIKTNHQAQKIKKQLMCLPLLPTENFEEGYQHIKSEAEDWGLAVQFKEIFRYFESYWIAQVHFKDQKSEVWIKLQLISKLIQCGWKRGNNCELFE